MSIRTHTIDIWKQYTNGAMNGSFIIYLSDRKSIIVEISPEFVIKSGSKKKVKLGPCEIKIIKRLVGRLTMNPDMKFTSESYTKDSWKI